MLIVILDHENMGTKTIIMTLPFILAKIFPKIEFLVMYIMCHIKYYIFIHTYLIIYSSIVEVLE